MSNPKKQNFATGIFHLSILVAIAILLSACIFWTPKSVGEVDNLDGWKFSYPSYGGSEGNLLEKDDLAINIAPQNFQKTNGVMILPFPFARSFGTERGEDYFIVTISIFANSGHYEFRPFDTELTIESNNSAFPIGFMDWRENIFHTSNGMNCIRGGFSFDSNGDPEDLPLFSTEKKTTLKVEEGLCLAIVFALEPPDIETTFSLSLSGLTKKGEPIVVPRIRFREGVYFG